MLMIVGDENINLIYYNDDIWIMSFNNFVERTSEKIVYV